MIRLSDHVTTTRVDDELVLLDSRSGRYFSLNRMGARICDLLASEGEVDAVISRLLAEYEVSEDRLRSDVTAILEDLSASGLIQSDSDRT